MTCRLTFIECKKYDETSKQASKQTNKQRHNIKRPLQTLKNRDAQRVVRGYRLATVVVKQVYLLGFLHVAFHANTLCIPVPVILITGINPIKPFHA